MLFVTAVFSLVTISTMNSALGLGVTDDDEEDEERRFETIIVEGVRIRTPRFRYTRPSFSIFKRGAFDLINSAMRINRNANGYYYASMQQCMRNPDLGYCVKRCFADDTLPFCYKFMDSIIVIADKIRSKRKTWEYSIDDALSLVEDEHSRRKWIQVFYSPEPVEEELTLDPVIVEATKPEPNKCKTSHYNPWPRGRFKFTKLNPETGQYHSEYEPFPVGKTNKLVTDTLHKMLITGKDGIKLVDWKNEKEGVFLVIYDKSTGIPRIGKDINYSTEEQEGTVTINAEEPKSFTGQEIVIGFAHTHYVRDSRTIRQEISPSVGDIAEGARGLEEIYEEHEYKIRNMYKVHHPHLKMWIALVYEDSENNQHLVVKGYDTRMSENQAKNNELLDRTHITTVFFHDPIQNDIFYSIFLNSDGTLTDRCLH